jgi:Transposase domain (DUF772)
MAGLAILKHTYDLSDEVLCDRWIENPYYQFFCGEEYLQHELPFDRSSLTAGASASRARPTLRAQWLPKGFERPSTTQPSGARLHLSRSGSGPIFRRAACFRMTRKTHRTATVLWNPEDHREHKALARSWGGSYPCLQHALTGTTASAIVPIADAILDRLVNNAPAHPWGESPAKPPPSAPTFRLMSVLKRSKAQCDRDHRNPGAGEIKKLRAKIGQLDGGERFFSREGLADESSPGKRYSTAAHLDLRSGLGC